LLLGVATMGGQTDAVYFTKSGKIPISTKTLARRRRIILRILKN
jgi:hypothetical protein